MLSLRWEWEHGVSGGCELGAVVALATDISEVGRKVDVGRSVGRSVRSGEMSRMDEWGMGRGCGATAGMTGLKRLGPEMGEASKLGEVLDSEFFGGAVC